MRVLLLSAGIVLLDQITKLLVKGFSMFGITHEGMEYGESIHLIGEWLNITYIENPNMAFGLEFGGKLFLSIFAIVAAIGIVIYLYRHRERPLAFRLSLAFIVAGAIGNLIDRTFYGALYHAAPFFEGNVVDFIDFDLFVIHFGQNAFKFWPIFNVADMAVSIGVVLLLFTNRGEVESEEQSESIETQPGTPLTETNVPASDSTNPLVQSD